jgi:DNA-binding NarL/FixJ family response regulator
MNILIADRQVRVRNALTTLLQKQPGWNVSGIAKDTEDLLSKLDSPIFDALLLDWSLPDVQHSQLIDTIHHINPSLRIIVMSANPETKVHAESLGVDFFVNKADSPMRLITTLRICENELAQENTYYPASQFGTLI